MRRLIELLFSPGMLEALIDRLPEPEAVALLKVWRDWLRVRRAKLLIVPD